MELVKDYKQLSERCDEVVLQDYISTKKIIYALTDAFKEDKDLIFLSAPQIGLKKRAFALKFNDEIRIFFNPMISYFSKESYLSREKCICNDKEYLVVRNKSVELTFQNKNGTIYKNVFKEPVSAIVQCMIDSLEGVVVSDYGLEIISEFDEASEEEKQEVINMYLEQLKTKNDEMQEEIKNDENLSKINEAIDFMSNVVIEGNGPQPVGETKLNRKQRRNQDKILKQIAKIQAQQKVEEELNKTEEEKDEKSV